MSVDVTVVIAAWNAAGFIVEAIGSALDQRAVSLEVIVVDDGSTDGTAELARGIADARLRVFRHEHNLGPGAARNFALERARGAWVAVLDADDQFLPDRLATLLRLAQTRGADVVADNLLIDRGDGEPLATMFPCQHHERVARVSPPDFIRSNRLMQGRYNQGFLKPLFRTAFLRRHQIRYDERVLVGEDYLFLLEVLLCGGHVLLAEAPGYRYRVHERSLTAARLTHDRIRGMMDADSRLLMRYRLTGSVARAQRDRHSSLQDAEAYLAMTTCLRNRDPVRFAEAAIKRPQALRHFYRPARDRLKRWLGRVAAGPMRRKLPQPRALR